MRIPFPERVPLNRVAIFAGVLFAVQRFQGTALYFSAGCVAFILIAAFAFNAAGGSPAAPVHTSSFIPLWSSSSASAIRPTSESRLTPISSTRKQTSWPTSAASLPCSPLFSSAVASRASPASCRTC